MSPFLIKGDFQFCLPMDNKYICVKIAVSMQFLTVM